jgi:hypothetical protein
VQYSSAGQVVKVAGLAIFLGTVSGVRFVAPDLEPHVMAATSVGMLITYAVICRVFAIQTGRAPNRWTIAGLLGGFFATAVLLIASEIHPRQK